MLANIDQRFSRLARERSKTRFADLDLGRAANFARKDAHVIGLISMPSRDRYASIIASAGAPPHSPGRFTVNCDDEFWNDERLIRRVAVALIDFWNADQAVAFSDNLQPRPTTGRHSWCFWLDWRRTHDLPTLLPNVPVFGQPSNEREWHDGVERLWPEHAPWDHVNAPESA